MAAPPIYMRKQLLAIHRILS